MCAALACILLLVTVSGLPNDRKNGFDRQWLKVQVHQQLSQPLSLKAERLLGSGDHLYLSEPLHQRVYSLGSDLLVKDTIQLNVNKQLRPPVSIFADESEVYVHEFNSGKLFHKAIRAQEFDSVKLSEGPFVKSIQISDSLVVIRAFDKGTFRPIFKQINIYDGREIKSDLLSAKVDAGFSTDGILCSNAKRDRLFYIPYFRNGIYCLDNKMRFCYQQPTLDTVFDSGITVTQQGSGDIQKLYASAPRAKVNKRAFANDRLLFIESDLRADNEEKEVFEQQPVLDAYHVGDGSYAGSFHLPVGKQGILGYHINGEILYVLMRDRIISYRLESLPW
jgi:hypothetical protein